MIEERIAIFSLVIPEPGLVKRDRPHRSYGPVNLSAFIPLIYGTVVLLGLISSDMEPERARGSPNAQSSGQIPLFFYRDDA